MRKEKQKKAKDKNSIFTRIMAAVLVGLMVLAALSTVIYYVVANN